MNAHWFHTTWTCGKATQYNNSWCRDKGKDGKFVCLTNQERCRTWENYRESKRTASDRLELCESGVNGLKTSNKNSYGKQTSAEVVVSPWTPLSLDGSDTMITNATSSTSDACPAEDEPAVMTNHQRLVP